MSERTQNVGTYNLVFGFHALMTVGTLVYVIGEQFATYESTLQGIGVMAAYMVAPLLLLAIPVIFLVSLWHWRAWEFVAPASLLFLIWLLTFAQKQPDAVLTVVGVA